MIKTRLKYTVALPLILVLGIPALLISVLYDLDSTFTSKEAGVFVCILLLVIWIFMLIELRDKLIKIDFGNNEIKIRRYLGLGKEERYPIKILTGFQTSEVSGCTNLYLIKGKVRIAKSSSFYHSNFEEILQFSKNCLTDLGNVNTTITSEVKDALQKKQTN
ncbi:hypothetical protein HYN59_11240 [Flavobacterium album]|uniref:Uncharacterized protein n=2 Tax=Flavobacterium album TaxID=2175091 RepID=A0A2S1QZ50_9FLAO|nr:hypothetical protein HYN59_11240 [Flavobacterium album]